MMGLHVPRRRTVVVPCTVQVEQTPEHFHAHVALDGVDIREGDSVLIHGDPVRVERGERACFRRSATVFRAFWIEQLWTRLTARFELAMLCEVGFSARRRP